MDNKENFSGVITTTSRSLQLTQKSARSSHSVLHDRPRLDNLKKVTSNFKPVNSQKIEDLKEKRKSSITVTLPKRPSTHASGSRRKDFGERDIRWNPLASRSFSIPPKNSGFDVGSIGSCSSAPPSSLTKDRKPSLNKIKPKTIAKIKIDLQEDFETISLLTLAVNELGTIIETWRTTMGQLRNMYAEQKLNPGFYKYERIPGNVSEEWSSLGFEDSHGGTLEEIFQVWVHLIYFIINIKINIVGVINAADAEPFSPNVEAEKNIILQSIECAKFFSRLKMKSLANFLEEYFPSYFNEQTHAQFKNYEERVSSPFLFEMDFIHKKSREILKR